jgi:predicted DNA-binding transcriptional regulator YafY
VAKDTEKLIRQLSLISYLMAERRPVTATEIRRDVEGYSDMTEDAFARRFYADRAELDALGIRLRVDKPAEGFSEQENYSLAPEAFHLPAIAFTDQEHASLQTALKLLDGEFAYAEPLRLALQQITWGRPSPLDSPEQRSIGLGMTASAGGGEVSARLAKIDTAIYRRKRIEFEYFTMQSGEVAQRLVDPYQLLYQGGQFYLVGHSHERDDVRVFRLSRIRGKVAYATKAEHDFQRPADFDPREYANRIPWQLGDTRGTAEIWVSDRIAWHVERNFGPYGEMAEADEAEGGRIFRTPYSIPRLVLSWALGYGEHARIVGPPELAAEARERLDCIVERHTGEPFTSAAEGRPPGAEEPEADEPAPRSRQDAAIRPERFARLVTLASVLIAAGRAGRRPSVREVCDQLQISPQELREDISVLNVVNFGGGAYVIYAEVQGDEIEVDPEPYSDTFDRPARLLPIEANALIAAINFLGEHLSPHLVSARRKIEAALGEIGQEGLLVARTGADDSDVAREVGRAIEARRLVELEYYAPNEDRFSTRTVEPYALINGREGWYVATFDPAKEDTRHFRLDRVKRVTVLDEPYEPRAGLDPIADVEGWPRTGEVGGSRVAQVWISPEQARWAREERTVLAELPDGAVIIEWAYKGEDYLVKEVLKEAGDAAVLEPADAREAVLHAAERLLGAAAR